MPTPPLNSSPLAHALAAVAVALLLSACGGSSGGSGNAASASGTYWQSRTGADWSAGNAFASWGTLLMNPDGTGVRDLETNTGALVLVGSNNLTYTMNASRDVSMSLSMSSILGRLSQDGELLVQTNVQAGVTPNLHFAVRKGGTHSAASLAAIYGCLMITPTGSLFGGSAQFDGAGALQLTIFDNDGSSPPKHGQDTGTYTVAPDGAVTMVFGPNSYSGGVNASGELVTVSGETGGAGTRFAMLFLRNASGDATAASLNGSYAFHAFGTDPGGGFAFSQRGTATSNGAGILDLAATESQDGTPMAYSEPGLAYSVTPNGTLTITRGSGATLVGSATADGRIALFVGPSNSPTRPTAGILIR